MFRIFKTKNQEVIDIFKKIEDQLIIERKTNRIAKLYYDYNGEDRLEIRSSTFAYVLSSSYTDIIKHKENENDTDNWDRGTVRNDENGNIYISASFINAVLGSDISDDKYNTIMIGSIIGDSTKENIGIITDVIYGTNNTDNDVTNDTFIKINIIYSTKVITWNDYFD